jgi:type IV secretory pathway VirB3-like protein
MKNKKLYSLKDYMFWKVTLFNPLLAVIMGVIASNLFNIQNIFIKLIVYVIVFCIVLYIIFIDDKKARYYAINMMLKQESPKAYKWLKRQYVK